MKPHITHGCMVATPGPDGVRRHDFTTLELIHPTEGHKKETRCKHCDRYPGK